MIIALLHRHYDGEKLERVKAEMETLGPPTIRAIWDEGYGMWLAVEGCHRLRAADELGISPVIEDISDDETIIIQDDGDGVEVNVFDLHIELSDGAPHTAILEFEEA
jgi:hypothetical protein